MIEGNPRVLVFKVKHVCALTGENFINSDMMKYLKYYISTITLFAAMYVCTLGTYYPTIFFIGFSLFIILAVLSLVLAPYATASNNIFLQTLVRGISIGSWVFLWEAIVGVTIKYRPNRMLYRRYKRLLNAKIIFINDHRNPRRPRSLPGSSKRRGTKQLRRDNIHKSG